MSGRELTRVEVLIRVKVGTLSLGSAATLMAVSYRQAKRLARRYKAEGAKGLKHRSAGGMSNHARPTKERDRANSRLTATSPSTPVRLDGRSHRPPSGALALTDCWRSTSSRIRPAIKSAAPSR